MPRTSRPKEVRNSQGHVPTGGEDRRPRTRRQVHGIGKRVGYWITGLWESEFAFYNHETGKPFVDLDAGLALACRKAGIEGVSAAHAAAHVCFPSRESRSGYSDSPAVARAFDGRCNHARHAHKSRLETKCRRDITLGTGTTQHSASWSWC